MKKLFLLLFLSLFGLSNLSAICQDIVIRGRVTAETGGSPLAGVRVLVKGTNSGTVTDSQGEFRISLAVDYKTLVFSSVGYATKEVEIGNRSLIDVVLADDVKELSEIVVVAYGVQDKSSISWSVASVGADRIASQYAWNDNQHYYRFLKKDRRKPQPCPEPRLLKDFTVEPILFERRTAAWNDGRRIYVPRPQGRRSFNPIIAFSSP